jgi:hypothetical protein
MSGQPYLHSSDADKYRNQYIANLNLQIKNDDINLQANKIFKKTGQTPVQPTDTRNTTEKMADIERLKIDLRSSLEQIADGPNAQSIVNQLGQDMPTLQFVAQNIDNIIDMIKKKYKYGVLAAVFIPFIERYIEADRITRGVNIGMQESTGQEILLTTEQIRDHMATRANIYTLQENIKQSQGLMENRLLKTLQRDLSNFQDLLLDENILQTINDVKNAETRLMIRRELSNALNDLPSKRDIIELSRKLEIAMQHNDARAVDVVGEEIHQLLVVEPGALQQLQSISSQLESESGGKENPQQKIADDWINVFSPDRPDKSIKSTHKGYWDFLHTIQDIGIVQYPGRFTVSGGKPIKPNLKECKEFLDQPHIKILLNTKFGIGPSPKGPPRQKSKLERLWEQYLEGVTLKKDDLKTIINFYFVKNPSKTFPGRKNAIIQAKAADLLDYIDNNVIDIGKTFEEEFGDGGDGGGGGGGGGGGSSAATLGMYMGDRPPSQGSFPSGKGIKGKGISVDYSKGIQETNASKYIPFGKFIINPKRLENDIITLRRPKGSVPMPTQRTSQKLGSVIRKIVGGGSPSFEDLNSLDNEEKHYLHKLMKTTNLLDRVSVPAPSKEQDDKDINRFDVLRGEIMSGNDSHQLIKEFKLLIMKLVNKDLLPKSQSREILYDLMALGF